MTVVEELLEAERVHMCDFYSFFIGISPPMRICRKTTCSCQPNAILEIMELERLRPIRVFRSLLLTAKASKT